jgi:hypothetical protein
MLKRLFRLPSPALVVSMIALALVLGGTAVAATVDTAGDTKADTQLVKKLAPKLSVKHATTATTVGGQTVQKVQWKVPFNTTTQTILSAGGMTIAGSCASDGEITVNATGPTANDGELRIQGNTTQDGAFSVNVFDFGSSSNIPLVNTGSGKKDGFGQLVYATSSGHVLTFSYGFDFGDALDAAYDGKWPGCTLYGEAIYS